MRRRRWAALFTTQPRSWKRRIGFLAALLVAGWVGSAAALSPPEHPIILVHGLNSDASTWDEFLESVTQQGWTFGGQAQYRNGQIYYFPSPNARYGGPIRWGHIYTITFTSNAGLTYQQQGEELEGVINYILELTGKSKVICVGHSMGGLACRAYLSYARNPRVSQIITVGTPHLGSPLALLRTAFSAVVDSTGARILQPGALELNQLNTDALFRYRDTPVAYSSIIVDNDDVVSEHSQNLANVGLNLPLHTEIRIRLINPCTLNRFNHLCETVDEHVRIAITSEVVRRPVALVLKSDTPTTRMGSPLRIKLLASSANRTADLYAGILMPNGQFVFQTALGTDNPGWAAAAAPAANHLSEEELYLINFRSLNRGSEGEYTFYALLVRPYQSPYDGTRISNLAQTRFAIEPEDAPPVRIARIFLNTQNQSRHPDSPFASGHQFHLEVEVSGAPWPSDSVNSVEARSRRTGEVISVPFNRTLPERTRARYLFDRPYQNELGIFDVTVWLIDGRVLFGSSHSLDRPRTLPIPQGLRVDSVSYPTRFTFDPVPGAGKYWCWIYRRYSLEIVYGCPTRAVPDFTIPADLLEFGGRYILSAFAAEVDPTEPDDPVANPSENVSMNNLFLAVGLSAFATDY